MRGSVLFFFVCVLVYHLTTVAVGIAAQEPWGPLNRMVIIDHFHVEIYPEAAALALCLGLGARRWIVWALGAIVIPLLPLVWQWAVPGAAVLVSMPERSALKDGFLWAVEGGLAGVASCAAWELVARRIRIAGSR